MRISKNIYILLYSDRAFRPRPLGAPPSRAALSCCKRPGRKENRRHPRCGRFGPCGPVRDRIPPVPEGWRFGFGGAALWCAVCYDRVSGIPQKTRQRFFRWIALPKTMLPACLRRFWRRMATLRLPGVSLWQAWFTKYVCRAARDNRFSREGGKWTSPRRERRDFGLGSRNRAGEKSPQASRVVNYSEPGCSGGLPYRALRRPAAMRAGSPARLEAESGIYLLAQQSLNNHEPPRANLAAPTPRLWLLSPSCRSGRPPLIRFPQVWSSSGGNHLPCSRQGRTKAFPCLR